MQWVIYMTKNWTFGHSRVSGFRFWSHRNTELPQLGTHGNMLKTHMDYWLVVEPPWATYPFWKIWISWDHDIPNIWKNNEKYGKIIQMFQTTNQFLHVDHVFFFCRTWGCAPWTSGFHVGWASEIREKPPILDGWTPMNSGIYKPSTGDSDFHPQYDSVWFSLMHFFHPIFSVLEDYDGTDGTNNSVDEDTGTATGFFFDVFWLWVKSFSAQSHKKAELSCTELCALFQDV